MPQYQRPHEDWKAVAEAGGKLLDLDSAVKDAIFGGSGGEKAAPAPDLKKMIEELEASAAAAPEEDQVPAVFICPISLEPMADPVTLCTGQTYERANIARWLSMDRHRRTCPTSMQELWDDGALIPNRTLRHLIHAWFSQRHGRMKKRAADVHGRAAELVTSLRQAKGGQARVQALRDLRRLVASSAAAVSDAGAADLLVSLLGPLTSHAVGSEIVAILVDLNLDSKSMADLMEPARASLVFDMLNEGSIETKLNCTKLIASLIMDFRPPDLVSSPSLLVGLLRLIKDMRRSPDAGVLLLLRSICSSSLEQPRRLAVAVGAVPLLVDLLPAAATAPGCLEASMQILEELSEDPGGAAAMRDFKGTIPAMVRLLMRVSEEVTRLALSVLWAVCKVGPEEECAAAAVEAGLAAKLLLVIQSGCGTAMKQRSSELLKLCSLNYTASIFISKCKLTRTIQ